MSDQSKPASSQTNSDTTNIGLQEVDGLFPRGAREAEAAPVPLSALPLPTLPPPQFSILEAPRASALTTAGFDSHRRTLGTEDQAAGPATILIVDQTDLNRRLIRGILKAAPYKIIEATRPSEAFSILESQEIDLVVVDLMMPEMSGTQFCHVLKTQRRTQLIPILMMTGVSGMETEIAGLESGADEFLLKPLQPALLRTRVRTLLRSKALIDSLEEAETILFALAQAVEHRDHYTGLHCERLAAYSVRLGQALGLCHNDQLALFRGGYLHDIGKITIPDSILYKGGKLDAHEWELMRLHTLRGEDICKPMKSLKPVLPIIRSHHERWDGGGYPDGLSGENIPLLARIMQVADIYDALTTARPYKPAYTHQDAIQMMFDEVRAGWRDPELVQLFAEITQPAPAAAAPEVPLADWTTNDQMLESLEAMRRQLSR
ncbi:MAG: HD domain-containing phosphohydrolase [Acidobacteriota bacterium]